MRTDVIVVGAGPAGATVARELGARGVSVVLLDKAEFPRDKPCGGAVSVRCLRELGLDLSPVIERSVNEVRITLNRRRSSELHRSAEEPFGFMTQRSRLDSLLVEQAIEAGAVFLQRARLTAVESGGKTLAVRVRGSSEVLHGRVLVAADGANGVTAKMAGVELSEHNSGIALEGNISPENGFPEEWKRAIGLDFGTIDGGYAWVFPKGDHLNFGLGGYKHVGPRLRVELRKLVEFHGHDPETLWGVRGHHLPWRRETSPLVDGNVVLVGDAAGMLDPLSGEGIFAAVHSAKLAAAAITDYLADESSGLESYADAIEKDLLAENMVAATFHDLFYRWPSLFFGIEKLSPLLWRTMVDVSHGKATYADFPHGWRAPLWGVARVASKLVRAVSPATTGRD